MIVIVLSTESLKGIDTSCEDRTEPNDNETIGLSNLVPINNDNILATGVFTSVELYKLSKGK